MMVKEGNEYCGEHAVVRVDESPLEIGEVRNSRSSDMSLHVHV